MLFDEEDLRQAGLTSSDIGRVRRQSVGGMSGGGGYRYQSRYAVYRLICAAAWALERDEPGEFWIMEQNLCPVDDVCICIDDSFFEFCQLKTSDKVTWTADDGKLHQEFRHQLRLLKSKALPKGSFELVVITPHVSRVRNLMGDAARKPKVPRGLKYCTRVEHFPHIRNFSRFLQECQPVADALDRLCALEPTPDLRHEMFAAFLARWDDLAEDGKYLSLETVMEDLRRTTSLPLRGGCPLPCDVWSQAEEILRAIEDLYIELVDGYCRWRYRFESGYIPERCDSWGFEQFASRVIEQRPTDYPSFAELIPHEP